MASRNVNGSYGRSRDHVAGTAIPSRWTRAFPLPRVITCGDRASTVDATWTLANSTTVDAVMRTPASVTMWRAVLGAEVGPRVPDPTSTRRGHRPSRPRTSCRVSMRRRRGASRLDRWSTAGERPRSGSAGERADADRGRGCAGRPGPGHARSSRCSAHCGRRAARTPRPTVIQAVTPGFAPEYAKIGRFIAASRSRSVVRAERIGPIDGGVRRVEQCDEPGDTFDVHLHDRVGPVEADVRSSEAIVVDLHRDDRSCGHRGGRGEPGQRGDADGRRERGVRRPDGDTVLVDRHARVTRARCRSGCRFAGSRTR